MSEAAAGAVSVDIIFTFLALLVVLLRLLTRVFLVKNPGADDFLIAGAMASSIIFLAIVMIQIRNGLGRQLSFEEIPGFLQSLWATIPIYGLTLTLCKLSIAVQFYRVFQTRRIQLILRIIFAVLVIYGLCAVLMPIFTCWPVDVYWRASEGVTGTCIDKNSLTFCLAAINILTDLMLLSAPLPLLKRLMLPRRQKQVLYGIFGVGIFSCVVSVIRLQALHTIGQAPQEQQSVQGISIAIWSCIEINTAIICASVPALKALVVRLFPKFQGSGGDPYAAPSRRQALRTADGAIHVDRSIELRVSSGDAGRYSPNSSEKNLVSGATTAECFSTTDLERVENGPKRVC